MSFPARESRQVPNGSVRHPLGSLGVVLVAAGRGTRLGFDTPKAFIELHGRVLLEYSLSVISSLPHAGHLVVVVPDERAADALDLIDRVLQQASTWSVQVIPGGRERHESVRFGVDALPETVTDVLVHDAARPLASPDLFERVYAEVRRTGDSVIPALAVSDTIKRVDAAGVVHETVDRAPLVAVQTPQGFQREALAAAHATLQLQQAGQHRNPDPTDDAEVIQRAGGVVRTVAGERRAQKVTTAEDLATLEALVASGVTHE